jgi:hypothetical protein
MQLLLTTKRHFTIALWMPVKTIGNYPGVFERMLQSVMRRVEVCVESSGGHLEQLLQMYSFNHNTQIKCFWMHVHMDLTFLFRNVELEL